MGDKSDKQQAKIRAHETTVGIYYDDVWPLFARWWHAEETLGLHYAFYEKGIKSFKDAIYHMNEMVGTLLGLTTDQKMNILDAGCGVGGTSIYLAQKFPKARFTGITVTPGQVVLAKRFSQQQQVQNVQFLLGSFIQTGFPDRCFDGIFAVESTCYTQNIIDFVKEMYRVLKPGGRLVVIDAFRTDVHLNPVMQKIYDDVNNGRGKLNPPRLSTYTRCLEETGFIDITVRDITKNVSRSQMRSFLIGIPYFVFTLGKRVTSRRYDPSKDIDYYLGACVLAAIVGLSGATHYYATKAVKK